jgi:hypothetical protein
MFKVQREELGAGVMLGSTGTNSRRRPVLWAPHTGGTENPDSIQALG